MVVFEFIFLIKDKDIKYKGVNLEVLVKLKFLDIFVLLVIFVLVIRVLLIIRCFFLFLLFFCCLFLLFLLKKNNLFVNLGIGFVIGSLLFGK